MRRLALALALSALLAGSADAMLVFINTPRPGAIVFGEVLVEVEVVSSQEIASVEIELDGTVVARLSQAPYRAIIDVGQENRAHVFEVTAIDASGARETHSVVTGEIAIDDEVELELQQLYVTVTRGGERVLDLESSDFAVMDDGRLQTAVTFERGDVPLTAALLIDSSLSMEGDALAAALAGARAFVAGMGTLDEAKVMVFSDRLLATTPVTSEPAVVSSVMDGIEPTGSTAINDHLFLALKELDARQGRRVIVLLSDGLDIDSVLDMEAVAWKAGRVQSVVYWIRPSTGADLDEEHSSVWRDAPAQRREITGLAETVATSGGRVLVIDHIAEAEEAFREILQELRDQYVLGYYPTRNLGDGAWHRVEVRVSAPRTKVRSRGGYFDDES